jgi:hypothetical protein
MFWVRAYPDPEKVPPMTDTGALMTGWLPVILVGSSSLVLAVALSIATSKRWKNKSLIGQLSALSADLTTERARVVEEKETVARAIKEITQLKNDLKEAGLREDGQKNQKEDILTELRKREADLAELKTLSDMRTEQAENIKNHVIITKVSAGDLVLDGDAESGPCVTLALQIRNESLFNVAIQPKDVGGSLALAERLLQEPILVINDAWREPIENLRPFASASITLLQPLRGFEVERVRSLKDNPAGRFRLSPLRVQVTAVDSQYKVPPRNLRITPEIDYLAFDAFRLTKSLDSED